MNGIFISYVDVSEDRWTETCKVLIVPSLEKKIFS